MNTSLFRGDLVRLVAPNLEADIEALARWSQDAEYMRLLDSNPPRPVAAKPLKAELEKELAQNPDEFVFAIQPLAEERVIGFVGLEGLRKTHGDAWAGIGLGERDYWGKGCGTDAMRILLRYAFTELNLYRVSLNVFEYNRRAIRSYEKAGFIHEGRMRQALNRDGRRWDVVYMGILREEWERAHAG